MSSVLVSISSQAFGKVDFLYTTTIYWPHSTCDTDYPNTAGSEPYARP